MENELTKRVSLVELFYDLVFVYMISQATGLIHHLHHGSISPQTFAIFVLVMVVFINSWMVQTVFTNRYGKSSWTNLSFSFIDMAIVLYMSNAFTASFDNRISTFFVAAGLLSLTLGFQYLITYFQTNNRHDKQISSAFSWILFIRSAFLFVGGWIAGQLGTVIALIGILISWIAPAFTGKYTKYHLIIFSHLLERLTALIIISFGETIVGIADYFTQDEFSLQSIFIFVAVVSLFFTYILEFDHLINEHQTRETGNLLIYLHYFILFGISLITVAFHFIKEPVVQPYFANNCLYSGLVLFYIGLWVANVYNEPKMRVNRKVIACFSIVTLIGYFTSVYTHTFASNSLIFVIVTLVNAGLLTRFLIKRTSNG